MFALGIVIPSAFLVHIPLSYSATIVDADITQDALWTKEQSPYIITRDLNVASGAVLTIDPGVIVKIQKNTSTEGSIRNIFIWGSLVTKGTSAEKIYFTDSADDSLGGDTNNDGTSTVPILNTFGNWAFHLMPQPTPITFHNIEIRYANIFDFIGLNVSISDVMVTHSWRGIAVKSFNHKGGSVEMSDTTFDHLIGT
ncbi:hypothetical protein H0W32_02805, partial [Patescibacteria group bacterium]|nr:hypothetical protein [Patescibacteria group bacterium]